MNRHHAHSIAKKVRPFVSPLIAFCVFGTLTVSCASKPVATEGVDAAKVSAEEASASAAKRAVAKEGSKAGPLICKARKSKFRFDWEAAAPSSADGSFDQNSVSFDFKAANRPAGPQGENLKIGECGWAAAPMTTSKKETSKVSYKKLSDEATETFYKLRTGKVFKLPVRQGKNGLNVVPGAPVTVIR